MNKIKECVEFYEFLKKHGIKIRLSENSPCFAWCDCDKEVLSCDGKMHWCVEGDCSMCAQAGEDCACIKGYGDKKWNGYYIPDFTCASNSLKALRSWMYNNPLHQLVYGVGINRIHWWIAPSDDAGRDVFLGKGKTDDEALWALCKKIMEAK